MQIVVLVVGSFAKLAEVKSRQKSLQTKKLYAVYYQSF